MFEKDKIETDKTLMVDIKVPNSKTLLANKTFSSEMIVYHYLQENDCFLIKCRGWVFFLLLKPK